MSDFTLYLVRFVVVAAIIIVVRYFVTWIKEKIEESRYAWIVKWAAKAVDAAQQAHGDESGAERKAIVVELLKELLIKKDISISDAELDAIIEAAVWAMKLAKANNNQEG